MGDKLKNDGILKKETIMVTEGLIKDISEEKFCLKKNLSLMDSPHPWQTQ